MASTYPSVADTFFAPTADAAGERVLAEDWNKLLDALLAIEVTLGVVPQGGAASLHARLQSIFSWDVGYVTATANALGDGYSVPFNRTFANTPFVMLTMTLVGSDTDVATDILKCFGGIPASVEKDGFTIRAYSGTVPGGTYGYQEAAGTESFRMDWLAIDMA